MIRTLSIALFLVLSLSFSSSSAQAMALEDELKQSVKYLKKIPEIKWVQIKRNSVIVGWKGFPKNFNLINTEAALKGHPGHWQNRLCLVGSAHPEKLDHRNPPLPL